MRAIEFKNNRLSYLDQTKLPGKEVWKKCESLEEGFKAIKRLQVRGAPLIGVFAAYCVCVELKHLPVSRGLFLKKLFSKIEYLKSCRPTAVNLIWALNRMTGVVTENTIEPIEKIKKLLLAEAQEIEKEDNRSCGRMARYGAVLVKNNDVILTHCNAGFLAAAGQGTALGVIYQACKQREGIKVYVDETRPLLQGSRLTAWELMKAKVPAILICDNMAAYLMQKGKINKIFVGADRIAANGDTANKIGTYSVAVNAKYHKIPFYVVAPFSTFDLNLIAGKEIPIEERNYEEVCNVLGKVSIAPKNVKVYNPAFDVTPNELINAIVTDKGIIYPPFTRNIAKVNNDKIR